MNHQLSVATVPMIATPHQRVYQARSPARLSSARTTTSASGGTATLARKST